MTPKSLTYGWVVFLSTEQEKIWWGIISGEGCKNQISVLNLTTLRPIQDFHIQIPHKKVTVPERNSGPGDIFVKHLHVSEWYLTLDNWMKPPRDKAEKKLRMNLWESKGHCGEEGNCPEEPMKDQRESAWLWGTWKKVRKASLGFCCEKENQQYVFLTRVYIYTWDSDNKARIKQLDTLWFDSVVYYMLTFWVLTSQPMAWFWGRRIFRRCSLAGH